MIRQGVMPADFLGAAQKLADQSFEEAAAPRTLAAARKMSITGGFKGGAFGRTFTKGFGAASAANMPVGAEANFASTKGFQLQEAFLGDPSIKKLKEDIALKEKQNVELEDEIQRLRYNLVDKVGDNDVVLTLQKELEIKESQMKDRDDEIQELIDDKNDIEKEKITLQKEIEKLKVSNLLGKNIGSMMKGKGGAGGRDRTPDRKGE